jgi:hypothetical protein
MPNGPQERKLSRLRDGELSRVLDLFAGCGGLSLAVELPRRLCEDTKVQIHPLMKEDSEAVEVGE